MAGFHGVTVRQGQHLYSVPIKPITESCAGELVTQAAGDASSRVGRVNENGSTGIIDPLCRMIALHIYDAIIKVRHLFPIALQYGCKAANWWASIQAVIVYNRLAYRRMFGDIRTVACIE